jgi:L-rhamnonate dehydratase
MNEARVVSIEWATLEGTRPRAAGCNARLGEHGQTVRVPLARITADDGAQGFGASTATVEQASAALGRPLADLFDEQRGVTEAGRALDFALWDMMAKRAGLPVYALAAQMAGKPAPDALRAPCYDTSLYIDDLHLTDDEAAAALIADEARAGLAHGHRAFKIKVGRGARHMPPQAGAQRDVAVARAVREAVGRDATVMLDANNGYNLNLTKQVLTETAECGIFWMEEAFHEDRVLYVDLKQWLQAEGLATLIADGEGEASPSLLAWAQEGVVDVVQYDILSHGFTAWLALGRRLDAWGVRTAPHHYGRHFGNYAACHLAAVVERFAFVEWDEAQTPGLDAPGYSVRDGEAVVPQTPGFGLSLDDDVFREAITKNGYTLSWT